MRRPITSALACLVVAGYLLTSGLLLGADSLAETKAKAEKGDAEAQAVIGFKYEEGQGVEKDYAEAAKWYRKAAEQNNAYAQFNLGSMYYLGDGVEKDKAEAVNWFRKAAEQNYALAQYRLGEMYFGGVVVKTDYAEAVKWWRKAAEQNNALAQRSLGFMYAHFPGVKTDYAEAVKWYRKAAEQNSANAQFELGRLYSEGQGVEKDHVEAVKWYRKAAEQNEAEAQYNLGVMYHKGQGVEKDYAEAVKWFRKAAEQNDADSQFNLGSVYQRGEGVEKDYAEAVKWFRKAAEQNDADSQFGLGAMYEHGQGVEKDYVEAVKWYRKAAEQNYASAQYNLGVMYEGGQGVEKDYVEAVKWFRRAAVQNDATAQFALGVMYEGGRGVEKDYVEAYAWWNLAARTHANAASNRGLLEKRMSPQQVAEAQKRTKELRALIEISSTNSSSAPKWEDTLPLLPKDSPKASGTGFFITEDGYFVTNEHVVGEGTKVRLLTSTGTLDARLVKLDKANDLALLKATGKFISLPVATSRSVRLGATAATVGFPNISLQGFSPKLAKGEIASLSGAQDDARHFQISTPIQPGNSGGALVDERGNVIGVVVAKLSQKAALAASGTLAENVNYAVKSSYLLSFLESVPEVAAKLKEPTSKPCNFEDLVKDLEKATVLVLVY